MASKRRIRRRQCEHKRRFGSHAEATEIMRRVIFSGNKKGGWLHVYKCQFCHGYHYGHAPGGKQHY